jgi:CBS domain-containing protein
MQVRRIIEKKQHAGVIFVVPTETLQGAAEVLGKHRIGAVIVSRDGKIVDGILSERDIVRCLGSHGPGCMDKLVKDVMTASVIACHPDDTVDGVMEMMSDGRFRHMPVIENGGMIGVISIGDVVKARIDEIQNENSALTHMITNAW